MSVTFSPRLVLWMHGEHDLATRDVLSAWLALAEALTDDDVVADLSGVTFMAASSVGVLLAAHSGLTARDRSLRLRAPSPQARLSLRRCGATELRVDEPLTPEAAKASALGTWVEVPRRPVTDPAALPLAAFGVGVGGDGGP